MKEKQIHMLRPEELRFNPWNCNVMTEEELQSLETSLAKEGIQSMAPVMVRMVRSESRYQVVDGEHRVIAAKRLGWSTIPCIVADMDDEQTKRMCLALNLVHGKVNPIKLFDLLFSEWDGGMGTLSTRQLDSAYGHIIGQSWISRILQLRNLASPVKDEAKRLFESAEGEPLTAKHLLVIAKIYSEEDQMKFLRAAVATGVSVSTLERMVAEYEAQKVAVKSEESAPGPAEASHEPRRSASTDSLMKCECGSSYLINWRRKTAARVVDDGAIARAVHVELTSQS